MHTTTLIRRHIAGLKEGELFTTRDLLSYGSRTAVDHAIYNLVRSCRIIRVVRGVFTPFTFKEIKFSVWEVAAVKARSFGRRILTDATEHIKRLNLPPRDGEQTRFVFAIDGSASSFRFGSIRIYFRPVGPRKLQLGESTVGQAMRAFWHLGEFGFAESAISRVCMGFTRHDHEELRGRAPRWIPQWLREFGEGLVVPDNPFGKGGALT